MKNVLILAAIFFCVVSVNAQRRSPFELLKALNTESSTNKITVYYSSGHEKRALELRTMIEDAKDFYEKKFHIKQDIVLAVLDAEQWKQVGVGVPYGVPNAQLPNVIFMAATTDNATTATTIALKPKVSAATAKLIKETGFKFDEGAAAAVDLLALHEMGHLLSRTLGINTTNKWFSEFLASYFAYAYLKERQPKSVRLWIAFGNVFVDGVEPKYRSLADFERLYFGVGLENYAWYQAKFQLKGVEIYGRKKLNFIKELRTVMPASETTALSLDATLERLEKLSPGFINWSVSLK